MKNPRRAFDKKLQSTEESDRPTVLINARLFPDMFPLVRQVQALGISLDGLEGPLTSGRDRVLLPKEDIDKVIGSTLTGPEIDRLKGQIDALRRPVSDTGDNREWEMMALPEAGVDANEAIAVQPLTRLSMALLRRNAPLAMPLLPALTLTKILDPDPTAGEARVAVGAADIASHAGLVAARCVTRLHAGNALAHRHQDARHPEQLRHRHHALGHDPDRRRELVGLLHPRRGRRCGARQ